MDRPLTVRIYGDSLALPRPGAVRNDERYLALLKCWWKEVHERDLDLLDRTRNNQTAATLREWWTHDNAYFGPGSDVLIVHCGVVDCAPRPLPPNIRDGVGKLPEGLRRRVVRWIHDHRPHLVRTGRHLRDFRVLPPDAFRQSLGEWMKAAQDHHVTIYAFNIAPTNPGTEARSPGFSKSIQEYNAIIADVVREIGSPKIKLLDVHEQISSAQSGIDRYIIREDGHHLTAEGHRLYFEQIVALETTRLR